MGELDGLRAYRAAFREGYYERALAIVGDVMCGNDPRLMVEYDSAEVSAALRIYSVQVMKARWPEAEPYIFIGTPYWSHFGLARPKLLRQGETA